MVGEREEGRSEGDYGGSCFRLYLTDYFFLDQTTQGFRRSASSPVSYPKSVLCHRMIDVVRQTSTLFYSENFNESRHRSYTDHPQVDYNSEVLGEVTRNL